MSVRPKFDEAQYRRDIEWYLDYIKAAWKISVEVAEEEFIAPPASTDDAEASDLRRGLIYDVARIIFDKLVLDIRDITSQDLIRSGAWRGDGPK